MRFVNRLGDVEVDERKPHLFCAKPQGFKTLGRIFINVGAIEKDFRQ